MALNRKYLERLRRQAKARVNGQAPPQQEAEHPDTPEELVRKARAAGHTGPLVLGPARSSLKHSWRVDAKWLEKHYPEEFGPPQSAQLPALPREITHEVIGETKRETTPTSTDICSNASPAIPAPAHAPPPITPLSSAFWQGLLFGSPDSLIPGADATHALHLVADKVGSAIEAGEPIASIRAGLLRKEFHRRFGLAVAERALVTLWRAAPASAGAPEANVNQSHCTPGVSECPRSMPTWRREFQQEVSNEQWLLESMGGWCG
jgi:hypothetical protein